MPTWCVWARQAGQPGWSCVRAGMTEDDATRYAAQWADESGFPARAMPERGCPCDDRAPATIGADHPEASLP